MRIRIERQSKPSKQKDPKQRLVGIIAFIALVLLILVNNLEEVSYGDTLSLAEALIYEEKRRRTSSQQLNEGVRPNTIKLAAGGQATPDGKVFSHFLSHIPKSGTSYAFQTIIRLLFRSPEWLALPEGGRFRACDEGTRPITPFKNFRSQYEGTACTMWMSEKGYTSKPEHIYSIVREPREHVLSMYFHCKESRDHKRHAHLMPSLDEWLDAWVDGIGNQTKRKENKRFRCKYNQINHQSKFMQFDPDKPDKGKEDLKSRYDVIGDNAQMAKSVCVIFIRFAGWVPKECDCSAASNALSIESNLTAVNVSSTIGRRQLREFLGEHSSTSRRIPRLEYDTAKHSHGVTHHGATFKTTQRQDQAIAKLRDVDSLLYNISQEIFKEQLQEVEEEYQIKVCDQFREQGADSRRR